ncbi:MAG: membrane protein insertase YidC [Candidatus Omnitrophica bacterium]|nr:membrane protein insertase YidC [Candidatus Omnitrophota bacterium]
MEKRVILAFVLSVCVVLVFQNLLTPPKKNSAPLINQAKVPEQQVIQNKTAPKVTAIPSAAQTTAQAIALPANEIETKIETDRFILTFSNIGGTLKKVILKEYNALLIKIPESETGIFGMTMPAFDIPLDRVAFHVSQENNKVIYTFEKPGSNIRIRKEFKCYNYNDYIELQINVDNSASAPVEIGYELTGPSHIQPVSTVSGRDFIELDADVDGKVIRKSSVKAGGETYTGIISWIGLKNLYYCFTLKPHNAVESVTFTQNPARKLSTDILLKRRSIEPNTSLHDDYLIYIGPLIKKRISGLNAGMEGIINYGFFGPFTVGILILLGWINMAVHNWGVAIIVVTIIINIILFPLTKKSFVSMQKMQELQPHMEKLRQMHKDNPQKLNKEIMELYKQYNVNPFGGCLPMLLQLPIFFGFYQALVHSLELKDARFLWIKDLSGPDALFTFSQPLPFLGDKFNILPLITLVVMVVQQKVSTASQGQLSPEMAQQQKIMAIFFPIFFGFILYNFPSGLVVYWLTNSILMTGEQLMLRKQMKAASVSNDK